MPRAGQSSGPTAPTPSTRLPSPRSSRSAGGSARQGGRRRCRSHPRASPRPRSRSRAGSASPPARSRRRRRLPENSLLDHLPVAVQRLELSREEVRLASILGEHEVQATSGRPSRPAALIRGARRNATAVESSVAGSTPATRINACRPGFCVRQRARSPAVTSARFSSTSGTTSAIVASATRSRCRVTAGSPGRAGPGPICGRRRCRRDPGTGSRTASSQRRGSPEAPRRDGGGPSRSRPARAPGVAPPPRRP